MTRFTRQIFAVIGIVVAFVPRDALRARIRKNKDDVPPAGDAYRCAKETTNDCVGYATAAALWACGLPFGTYYNLKAYAHLSEEGCGGRIGFIS